ncbi:MAG: hypothetical protein GEU28_06620 [Dehalococcoidia bacterium]|nr:hypothetical protein [Dehalococcoidia bacterium]
MGLESPGGDDVAVRGEASMIRTIRRTLLLLSAGSFLIAAACGGGDGDAEGDIEDGITSFIEELGDANFDDACDYLTRDFEDDLLDGDCEEYFETTLEDGADVSDIEVSDIEVDDDDGEAEVSYRLEADDRDEELCEGTYTLVQDDDDWLIGRRR